MKNLIPKRAVSINIIYGICYRNILSLEKVNRIYFKIKSRKSANPYMRENVPNKIKSDYKSMEIYCSFTRKITKLTNVKVKSSFSAVL